MLLISIGNVPESWLLFNFNRSKNIKFTIVGGIDPVKLLLDKKRKLSRFIKLPISGGIWPENLLSLNPKYSRFPRFPIEDDN